MMVNKVNKIIDILKTKIYMIFKQKEYKGDKYNIKYVFENNNSDKLLIVFTACTKKGQKARYNYIRTVENYKINKLFILDDFGFDNRGAYYLGKDKDFKIQEDVRSLISKIVKDFNIKDEVYIGSSKGGYAALYFGIERQNTTIITGAPQYNLGDYLAIPNHKEILEYIMGDAEEESINILNKLMMNQIYSNKDNNNKVFLHYSTEEETFNSDLKFLVDELSKNKINAYYDKHNYKNHSDLTQYFPKYIKSILNDIVN